MSASHGPGRGDTPRELVEPTPRRPESAAARDPAPSAALAAARDHAVLAAALDPIITIDAYGVIQSASDSAERVFGWTPQELIGRNVNVLMPDPHHLAHDGYLAGYRRTGRTNILGQTREFEGVRRGGEVFPIDLSVARVDPPGGGLPLFVGIIRDITERKRLERELRLIQDLALSISNAANLSGALNAALSLIGTATEWDYGEAWLPTREDDELVGVASWLRPGSGLESFAKTIASVRFRRGFGLGGRAWESGHPVWVGDLATMSDADFCRPGPAREAGLRAACAVPIVCDDEPIAVLLFFVRTTRREDLHLLELVRAAVAPLGTLIRRKQAEEELANYRRGLEERVEERTKELQQSRDQLLLADRLASIGTLAAGLGHDMNNVLLPVRAHLNALRAVCEATRGPEQTRRHVEEIHKSVAYLQQLADGLHFLAMDPEADEDARDGDGTIHLRRWWSQTGVLISKAVPRHVRVTASIPARLPGVAVASHRLTQALLNLVVNAGEAIPAPSGKKHRQGRVRIWAEDDPTTATVRLGVTDNGRGMTDEVRRRAFEMFYTTKSRGLGTGLGLALVNKVMAGSGGRVEVESKLGKGTTVVLVLNSAASPAEEAARPFVATTVSDGRAAALIRHVLKAAGARIAAPPDPSAADIWIADPDETRACDAAAWRDARPGARLVLFGAPAPSTAAEWNALHPIIIEYRDDFEAMRVGIGRALAPAQPGDA